MTPSPCPECGSIWRDGVTCPDHFHQMLFWESENLAERGEVHHLLVLSFHLQHPSLYSPDGLLGAQKLLADFVVQGLTPAQVRHRDQASLDSGHRIHKIKRTPDSHGSYDRPIRWTMTAADVIAGGIEHYCENVRLWARSIYDALHADD